jgi:hypothetical protein
MQTKAGAQMALKPGQPRAIKGLTGHGMRVAARIMISGQRQNWAGEAAQFFGGESHIRIMIRAIQRKITAGNGKIGRGCRRQGVNQGDIAAEQFIPR